MAYIEDSKNVLGIIVGYFAYHVLEEIGFPREKPKNRRKIVICYTEIQKYRNCDSIRTRSPSGEVIRQLEMKTSVETVVTYGDDEP